MGSIFNTEPKDYKSMIDDIITIAEREGLVSNTFRRRLKADILMCKKGRSKGGLKHIKGSRRFFSPWIGINIKHINNPSKWSNKDTHWLKYWRINTGTLKSPLRGRKLQYYKAIKEIDKGKVGWIEYNRISKDPEIGDWFGDPDKHKGAVLALVLCHEIAHAIDYWLKAPGYGNHGKAWQNIYRVLRNNYVNFCSEKHIQNYQVTSVTFPSIPKEKVLDLVFKPLYQKSFEFLDKPQQQQLI